MTYLLLQTFLLLLSSYFLGALIACLAKRAARTTGVALPATATATAVTAAAVNPKQAPVPAAPRSIDPVQPKIDVLARPEPRPAPIGPDTSRFERALTGALTESRDVPRKPIVEIRPAVLKSPTGPAPSKPAPVTPAPRPTVAVQPPMPQPAPPKPQPAPAAPVQTPSQSTANAAANAAASAAAAVASAKAAAAAATPARATPQPAPKPAPQTVQSVPLVAPAPPPAPAPKPAAPQSAVPVTQPHGKFEGDDFQRIRAIDEDTERRLKALGVVRFEEMARWTPADVTHASQALGVSDRIDREQWIEQAQILAMGRETYYSRNRGTAPRAASPSSAVPASQPVKVSEPPRPMPAAQPTASTAAAAMNATTAAAAAAAAAATTLRPQPAPDPAPRPVSAPAVQPAATPAKPVTVTAPASASAAIQSRSVTEMANAAAAAIAAASASVTRGLRPIEPISPLSKANPNVSRPARLQDALKEQDIRPPAPSPSKPDFNHLRSVKSEALRSAQFDDLKRIRGIGMLIEKRLHSMGITSYNQIAEWTSADIDRISQTLDFKGRVEREAWIEQARILSSGGETEFSSRIDRGDVDSSRE